MTLAKTIEKAAMVVAKEKGKKGFTKWDVHHPVRAAIGPDGDFSIQSVVVGLGKLKKEGKLEYEGGRWYLRRYFLDVKARFLDYLLGTRVQGMSLEDACSLLTRLDEHGASVRDLRKRLVSFIGQGEAVRLKDNGSNSDRVYHPFWIMIRR